MRAFVVGETPSLSMAAKISGVIDQLIATDKGVVKGSAYGSSLERY